MRLNLGCGSDIREGYINVDLHERPGVFAADLSQIPWQWSDRSADEVMMLDFLEHFEIRKSRSIVKECARIIRPGGTLVVQVPDMEICCAAILRQADVPCNVCGDAMPPGTEYEGCLRCGTDWVDVSEAAMKRMYGGQDYTGNYHMAGFTRDTLSSLLESCAFIGVRFVEDDHQRANWNCKAVARRFG